MRRTGWVFLAVFASAAAIWACSTPVFRYALERWEADTYRITVVSDGEPSAEEQVVIGELKKFEELGYRAAPLEVNVLNLPAAGDAAPPVLKEIAQGRTLPFLAVQYPAHMNMETVLWTDELSGPAARRIAMSPLRLEIANRLLAGDTAVWLLIRGTDPEQNRRVHDLVQARLRHLEQTIRYNDEFLALAAEAGREPPAVKFTLLEVDRNDPQEAVLIAMLTRVDETVEKSAGPILAPVFGQGRAALLMLDEFIADPYIDGVAQFLTGPCACEVKSLNPGFDLLIPADWIRGVTQEFVFDAELPPLTSPSAALEPPPEPPAAEAPFAEPPAAPEENAQERLFGGVLVVFILTVLGALAFTTWLLIRKNPS